MAVGHLIISRSINESVTIKDKDGNFICEITLVDLNLHKAKLSFKADTSFVINRNEVWHRMEGIKEGAA